METNNLSNRLICIQYPGRVENVDAAIRTLGGINQISEVMLHEDLYTDLSLHEFLLPKTYFNVT